MAAVAALVITGCSVESDDSPPAATSSAAPAPPAPAISPGVTADSIKVGFVYPDLEKVRQYINIDHGDYEAVFQALVDELNTSGGINGRRIEPVYGAVDVISPAGAQETCTKLTQDEKVFAVLGSLNANDVLCYVQTEKTVVVGGDLTAERYAKAQAPWISDLRGGDEVGDGLQLFAADDQLKGKKVGVVAYVADQPTLDKIVTPAFQKINVPVAETGVLDADITDPAAVSQQMNVFIEKFQAAKIDTILVVGGAIGQFPTQLEKTDYRPKLLLANLSSAQTFTLGAGDRDLGILNGAETIGLSTDFTEPGFAQCSKTIVAAIPALAGKLLDPTTQPSGEPSLGTSASVACRYLELFRAVAEKAGKDLTYQSFQQAAFSLGSLHLPTYVDAADYSRETPAGAIPSRLFAFDPEKRLFVLAKD